MKKSQIDKAIEQLESERAVLDLAIAKLQAQQETKKAPRAVRTKLPRPGELRDRAILGGEPSL